MLNASNDFRNTVYAQEREFKGRAVITMDAFDNVDGRDFTLSADFTTKVVGSFVESPHISKYVKSSLIRVPSYTGFAEVTQSGYYSMTKDDTSYYKVSTTTTNVMSQTLFGFDVISMLEDAFGKYIWGGKTLLVDKVAIAKTLLTNISAVWTGYANAPTRSVFRPFRYIRDWLNGSTANANNYWNEIQCLAGATNRCSGKTPTISSGTLTNGANITNGNVADYGYEASANGVAKYVQIDLGSAYADIDTIKINHYYVDGRTFHGTKTEISQDGINWYTVYDSAVSGEYAETSAGKTYTSTSGGNQSNFTIWDNSKVNWGSNVTHTNTIPTALTRSTTYATNVIGDDGFVYFLAWAFSTDGVTASDLYTDFITFSINGTMTDTRVYDDETIMNMTIVEEMSVLNDTLPANELQITLDNTSGELDLVNFENMQQVIASKPVIRTELGITTVSVESQDVVSDMASKVRGSVEENPNSAWYISGGVSTDLVPTGTNTEFSQSAYDSLELNDGNIITISTSKTSGYMAEYMFAFNVIEILERKFGTGIWQGVTELADKVAKARVWVKSVTWDCWCKATAPTNNNLSIYRWNLTSWYSGGTFNNANITQVSMSSSSNYNFINDDGFAYLLIKSDPSDGVTASTISCEYIKMTLTVYDLEAVEWLPSGVFFLTDWKNDVTNKIISLTCHDYFANLSDTTYTPLATTNLKTLAADVLTKGGVPTANQIIDDSLNNMVVNIYPERTDCRTMLQNIGIASQCAVYQDREGNVCIQPFRVLDEETNYVVYPTSQGAIYGYPGTSTYPLNSTSGGMKYLDFEQMWEAPQVTLNKAIYQLVINVYDHTNADGGLEYTEKIYTNTSIVGVGGLSFTIDNALIKDDATADKVADWYFRETNYNLSYSVNWRQNPMLECADVILIEDSFGAEKQSRINKQEFIYDGSLSGITESRGGV